MKNKLSITKDKIENHKDRIIEKVIEQRTFFQKITTYLGSNLSRAVIILLVLFAFTIISAIINTTLFLILGFVFSIYLLLLAISLIKKGLTRLFNNKGEIGSLIEGYLIAVFGVIFLFTLLYSVSSSAHLGYLTYGDCFDGKPDFTDTKIVTSIGGEIYYSSITFFTIGYGDICPMGVDKYISILNGFLGVLFATIILGIAIAKYLERK